MCVSRGRVLHHCYVTEVKWDLTQGVKTEHTRNPTKKGAKELQEKCEKVEVTQQPLI